ncbi:C45 family autoproteolytic acyltransferase/hydrolase [Pseudonocardia hispaniensis]|uniref:C45 family autoproteolytic acyltransferase/hydrolase n=1 Tax=Pseudonocardia hispaniensis TaxID=904933 RepID=A0ABW1J5U9_9PSEU
MQGGALEYRQVLRAVTEAEPATRWQRRFAATWPGYRRWYLRPDRTPRPDRATAERMVLRHMPELAATYHRLVDLTGQDETAARFLSLWNPPRFLPGCSQLALARPWPVLCRNYDYAPDLFEAVVYSTRFTGRRVLGMADCLWGLLDGMNDAGLAVSLAFGGRAGCGEGFGIPLVVRYLLEVAETTAQAREVLVRLPVSMSYNLTIIDATGTVVTAYLDPGGPPEFSASGAATNHRGEPPDDPERAQGLRSVQRRSALLGLAAHQPGTTELVTAFLADPLYNTGFSRAFGTLYTALYRPTAGFVDLHWPGRRWRRGFDDPDATRTVTLREPDPLLVR